MSIWRRFGGWVGALALAATIAGCQSPPPEQHLRESVTALHAAIEARDASALDEWLAEDFIGPDGLDRQGAKQMARMLFMRHRSVGLSTGPMRLKLQDEHASIAFTVVATGGAGGLLPEQGRIYHAETGWRLDDGDWRMASAHWSVLH